jgi:hypothetical protein
VSQLFVVAKYHFAERHDKNSQQLLYRVFFSIDGKHFVLPCAFVWDDFKIPFSHLKMFPYLFPYNFG